MENPEVMPVLQQICTQLNTLTSQVSELQANVNELKTVVSELKDKVNELDSKVNELDAKFTALDAKVDALDAKVDRHYEENRKEHFEIKNTLIQMQKDIKDLRTDIDTVYDLQKDSINSRKKLNNCYKTRFIKA